MLTRRVRSGVALVLLLAACGGSSTPALEATTPARSFRIVYRIEQPQSGPRWGELVADRPFDVRTGTYDHDPRAGERPDNGTLTTVDRLFQLNDKGLQEISGRQPSPGTGDQWLVPQLHDAVERKLAHVVGTDTVLGLACTTYRFKEPPIGPIAALSGTDHDDLCLTSDDLLLREVWRFQGREVLRRTAVRIERSPRHLGSYFDVSQATPPPVSGPIAAPAQNDSSYLRDPAAPSGFHLARREAFALVQPGDQGPVTLYISTVWAFTRGAEIITVEAGDSGATTKLPWLTTDPSREQHLPVGTAQSVVRNDGVELRVPLRDNRWLRIRGTVPLAEVVRFARTLRLR